MAFEGGMKMNEERVVGRILGVVTGDALGVGKEFN